MVAQCEVDTVVQCSGAPYLHAVCRDGVEAAQAPGHVLPGLQRLPVQPQLGGEGALPARLARPARPPGEVVASCHVAAGWRSGMQCGVAADSRRGPQLPPPGQRATAQILAPKQAGPAVTSLLATVALHSPVTASFLYFSLLRLVVTL